MRAVIYARYSTDLQSEASIEDQIRLCRARIDQEGWTYLHAYHDKGMSGASKLRPGYQLMLDEARKGTFDIVVAEGLDRLSRDQEDVAALFKQLSFADVKLFTLAEGEISELHVGLKGTMNALFLKDLAQKTRRGLEGRVRQGKSGGGNAYGYDVIHKLGDDGDVKRGDRKINDAEAEIVRRIFAEFAAGKSPRAIARDLNADKVPGPGGRDWMDTTIRGHNKRGTGILNNELYIGRMVWNRLRYIKDPVSGKRRSRLNPKSDWIIEEVPHLRVIDDTVWDAVKARQADIQTKRQGTKSSNNLNAAHRAKYLFSGLIKCGSCGGGYTIVGEARYGCANHRNKGTCDNPRTITKAEIEERVLAGLRDRLVAPDLIAEAITEFEKEWNSLQRDAAASKETLKREREQIDRRIERILNAIEEGIVTPSTKARLMELEARKTDLEAEPEPAPLPRIHPNVAELYKRQVTRLTDALNDPAVKHEAIEILRQLIDKIVIYPGESRGECTVELHGQLASILALANTKKKSRIPDGGMRLSVVAGARNSHLLLFQAMDITAEPSP